MKNNTQNYKIFALSALVAALSWGCISENDEKTPLPVYLYGMTGEPTDTSALIQFVFEMPDTTHFYCRAEWSSDSLFHGIKKTPLMEISRPGVAKFHLTGLEYGTRYFCRPVYMADTGAVPGIGSLMTFSVLPGKADSTEVKFAVSSCMHYERFWLHNNFDTAVAGQGYPALKAIMAQKPHFWIANGDNVYYDHSFPYDTATKEFTGTAISVDEMRDKWKVQFSMPYFKEILSVLPVFWLKDDHDFRYDDADRTDSRTLGDKVIPMKGPSVEDGISIFREQVPVVEPGNSKAPTYRTVTVNDKIQLWLLEGRDYRDPNAGEDGLLKSMWSMKQREWLMQTLKASKAEYKIIISPTPLVGPDDAYKRDNHTNLGGFKYEGESFLKWMKDKKFATNRIFIIAGDRHWQYHSIHPTGFHEFGSGALVDGNTRMGRRPGDMESTDPKKNIKQPFNNPEPTGGFIMVEQQKSSLRLTFLDDTGKTMYTYLFK